jgi:hypothetical protein
MHTASHDSTDMPAQDWQGQPITASNCAACAHADLRKHTSHPCAPAHSCVHDVYARRIDRFFRHHPAVAGAYLAHPYFEVRAIAVRHADLFGLAALLDDPDETVRLQLALRLPQRLLRQLLHDPHREVRIRVAHRIDTAELPALVQDPDYQVRQIVAQRLPLPLLPMLMHDSDLQVRLAAAQRLVMPALWRLHTDPAAEVRRVLAQRLPAPLLASLADDVDWTVRWEVAGRATGATLAALCADSEAEVRERAQAQQATSAASVAGHV